LCASDNPGEINMKLRLAANTSSISVCGKEYIPDADGNIEVDEMDAEACNELVNVHGLRTPEATAIREAAAQAAWAAPIAAAVQKAGPLPTY
jgi:hypothetical protein